MYISFTFSIFLDIYLAYGVALTQLIRLEDIPTDQPMLAWKTTVKPAMMMIMNHETIHWVYRSKKEGLST